MSVNHPPKKEENDPFLGFQPYILRFAAVIALLLIVLPLLPGIASNLAYSFHSFGGKAPKIYWYLSRAGGFVSFSVLWISMALGLGITNKMARLWPGAPSAFALHQFTGIMGLAFAAYHGLVLMGDHFTDFSLPKLMLPFSIAYETVWIGLGQVAFYIWLFVILSFYIRQRIGQKTWRMIHYLNFAIYGMALLHGLKSGTDSSLPWVTWYFRISAVSLAILLAYRIYELSLKNKFSISKFTFTLPRRSKETRAAVDATSKSPTRPSKSTKLRDLPLALLRVQAKKPGIVPMEERVLEPVSIQATIEPPALPQKDEMQQQEIVVENIAVQQEVSPAPAETVVPTGEPKLTEIKKTVNGSVVTVEGMYQGKPIHVRIFGEPKPEPLPEKKEGKEIKSPEKMTLVTRLRSSLGSIPVEPPSGDRNTRHMVFSED